jgi:hypothetical protein
VPVAACVLSQPPLLPQGEWQGQKVWQQRGEQQRFPVGPGGQDADDGGEFEKDFRGAGTWNYPWPNEERNMLRQIIGGISYWACDGHSEEPHALRLDESRILGADEAWIPVITPDGPGVLVCSTRTEHGANRLRCRP